MTLATRIRRDLEAQIHSGGLPPGARIPFETELAAQYGCARATVSKALAVLASAGVIERRRRAGSFVAQRRVQTAVLAIPDLEAVITALGSAYRWQLRGRRAATAGEATEAEIPAPALWVAGVHYAGDAPFALEERLIGLAAVPEAAREAFAATAPGRWLADAVPWTRARHTIAAQPATAPEARALGIAPGSAVLNLTRQTWRAEDANALGVAVPVTHVRQLFPGSRYRLVAEFDPGG